MPQASLLLPAITSVRRSPRYGTQRLAPQLLPHLNSTVERLSQAARVSAIHAIESGIDGVDSRGPNSCKIAHTPTRRAVGASASDLSWWVRCRCHHDGGCGRHRQPRILRTNRAAVSLTTHVWNHFERPRHRAGHVGLTKPTNRQRPSPRAAQKTCLAWASRRGSVATTHNHRRQDPNKNQAKSTILRSRTGAHLFTSRHCREYTNAPL